MIQPSIRPHRIKVFKVLLVLTFFGGCGFFMINYSRDLFILATLELLIGLTSLILLLRLKINPTASHFKLSSITYVFLYSGTILFALGLPEISTNIYVWIMIIPLMAYLLLGTKRGFLVTATFMALFVIRYISHLDYSVLLESPAVTANIFCCVLAIWGMSHAYENATETSQKQLRILASVDHLTGLLNRSLLIKKFNAAKGSTVFAEKALGLIVIDIDRFKSINDAYGHDVGDQVLKGFAKTLKTTISDEHDAFRLGGEEFCVIMSNTSMREATNTAELIRKRIMAQSFKSLDSDSRITVSCGVATSNSNDITFELLHAEADKLLFSAKSQGRNRVVNTGVNIS